jgi:glycerate 2-kinase
MIQNYSTLATSPKRADALNIVTAGINRLLPGPVMRAAISYDSARRSLRIGDTEYAFADGRLVVVGGGKAAGLMAAALEEIVGPENIASGCVTCKGGGYGTRRIEVIPAGHPVPDRRGVDAVRRMLDYRDGLHLDERDLVLCLLSGGASALMPCPVPGVTLGNKQRLTELLLASGAPIEEINIVRKHLSVTKGGGLGRHFAPRRVVTPVISDVIGNRLEVIASAPTYPDTSTYDAALGVLADRGITDEVPPPVLSHLRRGAAGEVPETPRELPNCTHHIIGDNRLALEAMAARASKLGYRPKILSDSQQGDAATLARARAAEIIAGRYAGYDCLLIGGEATIELPAGPGQGGRNQHYAAVTLLSMADCAADWVAASVGTDGSDYMPDVAGAIVDGAALSRLAARGINGWDYVYRADSYHLLGRLGDALVRTGDTGTNVGDVMVYLI